MTSAAEDWSTLLFEAEVEARFRARWPYDFERYKASRVDASLMWSAVVKFDQATVRGVVTDFINSERRKNLPTAREMERALRHAAGLDVTGPMVGDSLDVTRWARCARWTAAFVGNDPSAIEAALADIAKYEKENGFQLPPHAEQDREAMRAKAIRLRREAPKPQASVPSFKEPFKSPDIFVGDGTQVDEDEDIRF